MNTVQVYVLLLSANGFLMVEQNTRVSVSRRQFGQTISALTATGISSSGQAESRKAPYKLNYVLSSAMYGEFALNEILPEVKKTGAKAIDIWCRVHGNQREQIDEMGVEAFRNMLRQNEVGLGVSTRYPLGPFGLQQEMEWLKRLGGKIVLCGTKGPREPQGVEARVAVKSFLEQMKPHVELAEELGVTIALENHDRQLLYHPDSLRYFAEFNRSPNLGIALAFHHLHKWQDLIPQLCRELCPQQVPFIYFQEHSEGIRVKAAKEIEMQQLPGFGGGLDYIPIVKALKDVKYKGFVEIFMHPVPRGIPILPTVSQVTAAINKSRTYIDSCLSQT